eukprot:1023347-Rhodomonas_salina.1
MGNRKRTWHVRLVVFLGDSLPTHCDLHASARVRTRTTLRVRKLGPQPGWDRTQGHRLKSDQQQTALIQQQRVVRKREIHTGSGIERASEREGEGERGREGERERGREGASEGQRQRDRETDRVTDRETERQRDRETDTDTDTHTHTHNHTHTQPHTETLVTPGPWECRWYSAPTW